MRSFLSGAGRSLPIQKFLPGSILTSSKLPKRSGSESSGTVGFGLAGCLRLWPADVEASMGPLRDVT